MPLKYQKLSEPTPADAPVEQPEEDLGYIRRYGPSVIRGVGGFLGATPVTGALGGAGSEILAEMLENGSINPAKLSGKRIAAESAVGAAGGVYTKSLLRLLKEGRVGLAALRGAASGAAAPIIRHGIEEGEMAPMGDIATGGVIGAATGGTMAKLFGGRRAPLSIDPRKVVDDVPPPAPAVDATKKYKGMSGLRVAMDDLKNVANDVSNPYRANIAEKPPLTPGTPEYEAYINDRTPFGSKKDRPVPVPTDPFHAKAHAVLSNNIERNPTGAVAQEVTKIAEMTKAQAEAQAALGKDAVATEKAHNVYVKELTEAEKAQQRANEMLGKEAKETEKAHVGYVEGEAKRAASNENARRKFILGELSQDTKNETARGRFIKNESAQAAKNLESRKKWQEQQLIQDTKNDKLAAAKKLELENAEAAQRKIDTAIEEGLVPGDKVVTETATENVPGGKRTLKQSFRKPQPKPGEGDGDGTPVLGPNPNTKEQAQMTMYPTKEAAMEAALGTGATGLRRVGRGKWRLVFDNDTPANPLPNGGPKGLPEGGASPLPNGGPSPNPTPNGAPKIAPEDIHTLRFSNKVEAAGAAKAVGGTVHQIAPRLYEVRLPQKAAEVIEDVAPKIDVAPAPKPEPPKPSKPYVPPAQNISRSPLQAEATSGGLAPEEFRRYMELQGSVNGAERTPEQIAEWEQLNKRYQFGRKVLREDHEKLAKQVLTLLGKPEATPGEISEAANQFSPEDLRKFLDDAQGGSPLEPPAPIPSKPKGPKKPGSRTEALTSGDDPELDALISARHGDDWGASTKVNPEGHGKLPPDPPAPKAKTAPVAPKANAPQADKVKFAKENFSKEGNAELDELASKYRAAEGDEKRALGQKMGEVHRREMARLKAQSEPKVEAPAPKPEVSPEDDAWIKEQLAEVEKMKKGGRLNSEEPLTPEEFARQLAKEGEKPVADSPFGLTPKSTPKGPAPKQTGLFDEPDQRPLFGEKPQGKPTGTPEPKKGQGGLFSSFRFLPKDPKGGTTLSSMGGGQLERMMEIAREDPAFTAKLIGGAGGALAGGYANKDEDPIAGALVGGLLGATAGGAAHRIPQALQNQETIKQFTDPIVARLPNVMRSALLSHPMSMLHNSVAGPWGANIMGGLEQATKGKVLGDQAQYESGVEALKGANPVSWLKGLRDAYGEASQKIDDVEELGRFGKFFNPESPNMFDRATKIPAEFMLTGDLNTRNVLSEAGIPDDLRRRITLTAEPNRAFWRNFANYGKAQGGLNEKGELSTLSQMLLPFKRTAANIMESGTERTPILGSIINYWGDESLKIPFKEQLVQQGLGGMVFGLALTAGMNTNEDTNKTFKIATLVSNLGGQYSLLANAGFLAGQAVKNGKSSPRAAVAAFMNGMPLPSAKPLADPAYKLVSGDPIKVKDVLLDPFQPRLYDAVKAEVQAKPGSLTKYFQPKRKPGPGAPPKRIKPKKG